MRRLKAAAEPLSRDVPRSLSPSPAAGVVLPMGDEHDARLLVPFRPSPRSTSDMSSRRCSGPGHSSAEWGKRCARNENPSRRSCRSAPRSGHTISPASISRPLRPRAAAWSKKLGSAVIRSPTVQRASIRSCRAGIRPTSPRSSPTIPFAPPGGSFMDGNKLLALCEGITAERFACLNFVEGVSDTLDQFLSGAQGICEPPQRRIARHRLFHASMA